MQVQYYLRMSIQYKWAWCLPILSRMSIKLLASQALGGLNILSSDFWSPMKLVVIIIPNSDLMCNAAKACCYGWYYRYKLKTWEFIEDMTPQFCDPLLSLVVHSLCHSSHGRQSLAILCTWILQLHWRHTHQGGLNCHGFLLLQWSLYMWWM